MGRHRTAQLSRLTTLAEGALTQLSSGSHEPSRFSSIRVNRLLVLVLTNNKRLFIQFYGRSYSIYFALWRMEY